MFAAEAEDLNGIPFRKNRSNKGSYGKVLTVAGQKNMAGAAFFSGKAAYLTGAGLPKKPTPITSPVSPWTPEGMSTATFSPDF